MKKIISIEGMMCDHCAGTVKGALEAVDGVKSVKVELKKKSATVKLADEVSNDTLSKAVTDSGFTVTGITEK